MTKFATAALAALAAIVLTAGGAAAGWRDGIFNHNTVGSISSSPPPAAERSAAPSASTTSAATPRPAARAATPRRSASTTSQVRRAVTRGVLRGLASYYWQPQRVASGGWFNPNALTAAHKSLPFGTRVRVTNLRNGRSVVVRINDRGPYVRGRIIDLSKRAASAISMTGAGIVPVSVEILG